MKILSLIVLILSLNCYGEIHKGLYFYNVTSGKLKNLYDNKIMYCIPAQDYFYKSSTFRCLTADFEKYRFEQTEKEIFLFHKKKKVSHFARILKDKNRIPYKVDDLANGHLYELDILDDQYRVSHKFKKRLLWTYDKTFSLSNLIPFRINQILELRLYKNEKKIERKRIRIYGED